MKIFFPGVKIEYPPIDGPQAHIYQLIKNLRSFGYDFITLKPDENPLTEVRPNNRLSILSLMHKCDIIYYRPPENPTNIAKMTSPYRQWLIPKKCVVIWEQNRALTTSIVQKKRSQTQIEKDIKVFRKCAFRVDAGIGVTQKASDELRDLLGITPTYTIQNASDPKMFHPDIQPEDRFRRRQTRIQVAWVASRMNSQHDSRLIEKTAHLIDKLSLPIDIHAFGNTHTLFSNPLPLSIQFHGSVSYFKLPRYLSGMDVGLCLYNRRIDGGSPLKLFDYMASGCVPICSPGQPIEEVLEGNNAGFIGKWNTRSLTGLLMEMQKEPGIIDKKSLLGRKLIENRYNWRNVAEKINQVIQNAVVHRLNLLKTIRH